MVLCIELERDEVRTRGQRIIKLVIVLAAAGDLYCVVLIVSSYKKCKIP